MKKRFLTVLALGFTFLSGIYFLGFSMAISMATFLILTLSAYEYAHLFCNHKLSKTLYVALISILLAVTLFTLFNDFFILFVTPYILWVFYCFLETTFLDKDRTKDENTFYSQSLGAMGIICFLLPSIALVKVLDMDNYTLYLMAYIIFVAMQDVAMLVFGKWLGKRKVFVFSPNKTLEGSVIGFLFTYNCAIVFSFYFFENLSFWLVIWIVVLIFGQMGDFLESSLKRYFRQKDSSNLLPGHGGFLDRFDSLGFSLPAYAILLSFL